MSDLGGTFQVQGLEFLDPVLSSSVLVDRVAVIDITHIYCRALDTKNWSLLDQVFTEDASAYLIENLSGRPAIKDRIEQALNIMDRTQHMVSNHEIVIKGDIAQCRCYLQAQHVRIAAHGGPNFMIGGIYEDELLRTKSGWRISSRRLTTTWSDGNPAVARR